MRLRELDAEFIKRIDAQHFEFVDALAEADGIKFLCPKCFAENKGPIGAHAVICWSPSVPQDTRPTPGRWTMQGTSIDDLTLVAGSSSVAILGGCKAHFFVRAGAIVDC